MGRKLRKLVLIAPIVIMYGLLIGGGLLIMLKESFGIIPKLGFHDFTLSYYGAIFTEHHFLMNLGYSLLIATIAASLSMIVGVLLAYKIMQSKSVYVKKMSEVITRLGLVMPYLYMIFMVMLLFSQSGLISRILNRLMLIDSPNDFPNLIYGMGGIVLTFVLKGAPFILMLSLNVMTKISKEYDSVAMTLGSKSHQTFRKIYLPLLKDTIVWGGMVLFAYDLGAFEVPYILSRIDSTTLSMKLYSTFISPNIGDVPLVMAMAVTFFMIGIVTVIMFAIWSRMIIRRMSQ